MKLTTPMIKAFAHIAHGVSTIESLARAEHKSLNRITEIVQDLGKEGFIVKKRNPRLKGSRLSIEVASTIHAVKLRNIMIEYSSIHFEEILADSKILFLAAVCEDWMDIPTATRLSKISRYAIDRYRPRLKNRGVIIRQKNLYKVNELAWHSLKEFLIAYKNYSQLNGIVQWKYQDDILLEVDRENLIQGTVTGLADYDRYGVQVGTVTFLCALPKREVSKEELFVHSLFEIDDPRTLHLALTFYLKNKLAYKKIMQFAMKYSKYTLFKRFVTLLKAKEDKVRLEGLPTFDRKDFIRIAHMYGVYDVP